MSDILNFSMPDAVEKTEDFVGFEPVKTGFYELTIKVVHLGRSASGAAYATIEGSLNPEGESGKGTPFNETIFFTSGDAKGRATTYERNGKKFKLPGLEMMDNLCEIITSKNLQNQDTEDKLVEVWDNGERVKQSRPTLVDLEDQVVLVAIEDVLENKREKNAAGTYVPTPETRQYNRLAKVLYPQGHTYNEKLDGIQETVWKDKWSKNVGVVRDLTQKVAGTAGTGAAASKPPLAPNTGAKKL